MRGRTCRLVLGVAVICAVSALRPGGARAAPPPGGPVYLFGVVPQFEQRKLHAIWSPIVAELSRRSGLHLELTTMLTIEDFERAFVKQDFDFVYMNPYHVLKSSYLPLVSDDKPLKGILVVRKEGPIRKLEDLEGARVAFPSPNALGASLLMRADLERLHHVKVKPLYVKTHSSVYLHVAQGITAAGGGVEKSLAEQDPAVRDALRVLYTTRGLQSHPFAALPRVPLEDQEKLRRALLELDATPEGRALLARVPTRKLVPVSRRDYEPMNEWGLDAYWVELWKEEPTR